MLLDGFLGGVIVLSFCIHAWVNRWLRLLRERNDIEMQKLNLMQIRNEREAFTP